jgi:alkanesulfonate monooxygenase SsuD/methylene tetrahydromethanopterin reductase-like flavin-dependent oxidoreductase (luciferase family)
MFMMPGHPPERDLYDAVQQDLEEMEWLDELGFSEVWVGEHLTNPWEPIVANDQLIAMGLARTKNIKVCSGGYIPLFHKPGPLALRIAQLDHIAQGRFICGLAASSLPMDQALVDVDAATGENRLIMQEALDIMIKMWTEHVGEGGEANPWTYEGKWATVRNVENSYPYKAWLTPFQKPHPPIAVASISPSSASLKWAGSRGYIPQSMMFNADTLNGMWQSYCDGAESAGLIPDRSMWRVSRDTFVADTDEEAKAYVKNSMMGRFWNEIIINTMRSFGALPAFKHDQSVPDEAIDLDYLIDHLFLVGSPETVTNRLNELQEATGGFGTLLPVKYDWGTIEDPRANAAAYRRNLELLVTEVVPNVRELAPTVA